MTPGPALLLLVRDGAVYALLRKNFQLVGQACACCSITGEKACCGQCRAARAHGAAASEARPGNDQRNAARGSGGVNEAVHPEFEKLKSNLQEVRARGGELFVFADPDSGIQPSEGVTVITMPKHVSHFQAPAIYTIPLQLLAYHCAILKGTDVDQPRNLAKSVTVE